MSTVPTGKDDEHGKRVRRAALKQALTDPSPGTRAPAAPSSSCKRLANHSILHSQATPSKALDSSLKRNTALIKRMKQSMGSENKDQITKDIEALALEKYVEEIVGAVVEGLGKCKTEKDVSSAVEVRVCVTLKYAMKLIFCNACRLLLHCTVVSLGRLSRSPS